MRTFIVEAYGNGGMGAGPTYRIMKENELKNVKYYGDFLNVYELASPRRVSKKMLKELGVPFMAKR